MDKPVITLPPRRLSAADRIALVAAGAILVGLAVGLSFLFPWPSIAYWAVDFRIFHAAASALVSGGNPYQLSDLIARGLPGTINSSLTYVYPPLLAELLIPLTPLHADTAARIWLAFNLLAPGLTLALILAACRWRPRPLTLAALLMGMMLFLPVLYTFLSGQASLWVMVWIALAVLMLQREKQVRSGVSWAMAWVKPHPLGLVPLGLLFRYPKTLLVFTGVTLLSLVVVAPLLPAAVEAVRALLSMHYQPEGLLYHSTAMAGLSFLGTAGLFIRILITAAGLLALVLLARQPIGWKPLSVAMLTLSLVLAPFISRNDVALSLVPMLLILSDWRTARVPAGIALAAWAVPLPCALGAALGARWLMLPVVWGGLVQWLLAVAAAWYVWNAVRRHRLAAAQTTESSL